MKTSVKVLSVILSIIMILPVFGLFAFAAECEHEYQITIVAPTCVENGYSLYVCTKCGHSYKDYNGAPPALGHNYGDWYEVDKATCTKEGHMQRDCSRCGASEIKTIPAKGHIDANTDGKCDVCGEKVPVKEIFSPYDWFKALWQAIVNWFRGIFG